MTLSRPLVFLLSIVTSHLAGSSARLNQFSSQFVRDDVPRGAEVEGAGANIQFPPYNDTKELVVLSHAIYHYRGLKSCTDVTPIPILPPKVQCHMYERDRQDTQVMVLSHPEKEYVAVVFAGTDDFRNALTDADIITKPFGPMSPNGTYELMPKDYPAARVHAGFDHAVFHDGLFDRVLSQVRSILDERPRYRVLTTGHSLGAADSVLTSVAMRHYLPGRPILSINFGCPRTGNDAWKQYVNSLPGVTVWRFVNGIDIVPRLPNKHLGFYHLGHTVQMAHEGAKAYYLHTGDESLGFAGVPPGWGSVPFIIVPFNAVAHMVSRYEDYIVEKAGNNRTTYYVSNFEKVEDEVDDDDSGIFGDDIFPGPPENELSTSSW